MGKTMVVTTLILAKPADIKPVPDSTFDKILHQALPNPIKLKLTMVVVNNTLVRREITVGLVSR